MKKLIGTLSRMYFARHMEIFRGGIKGVGRAYDILQEAYPNNPFVEGFCEGGQVVITAYEKAIREQCRVSKMDSVVDFVMIGYKAAKNQCEPRYNFPMPEFKFEIPKFTLHFEETH